MYLKICIFCEDTDPASVSGTRLESLDMLLFARNLFDFTAFLELGAGLVKGKWYAVFHALDMRTRPRV